MTDKTDDRRGRGNGPARGGRAPSGRAPGGRSDRPGPARQAPSGSQPRGKRPPMNRAPSRAASPAGAAGDERHPGGARPERGARKPDERRTGAPPRKAPAPRKPHARPRQGGTEAGDGRERIAKVMARAGVASRRDAEEMIAEGRVAINGGTIRSPAVNVGLQDRVTIDGKPLPAKEKTRLWLYHKPAGLVTTAHDPEGRRTVFEALPEDLPRVISVGRLDINTEGLLLLTNDGGLARVLAHPETGWLRRYRVRAFGSITPADLEPLIDGITIEGMHYGPIEASIQREQGDNVWLMLGLREGKNREVKKVLEHLGLKVNRLIRVSFGPFQLGDMPESAVEEVKTRVLKDQLGTELAARAEVDFDAPLVEREPPRAPVAAAQRPHRERGREPDFAERRPPGPRERGRADFAGRERGGYERAGHERAAYERGAQQRGDRRFGEADRREGRDQREQAPREKFSPLTVKRSTWRADDPEAGQAHGTKKPRRGDDPKAARSANAERERIRAGRIEAPGGRKVVVERLVSTPKAEEKAVQPVRKPRRAPADAPFRPREERPRGQAARPPRPGAGPRNSAQGFDGAGRDRFEPRGERPQGLGFAKPFRDRGAGQGRNEGRGEDFRAGHRPAGGAPGRSRPQGFGAGGGARDRGPEGRAPRGSGPKGGGFKGSGFKGGPGGGGPRSGAPKGRPGGSSAGRGSGGRGPGGRGPSGRGSGRP